MPGRFLVAVPRGDVVDDILRRVRRFSTEDRWTISPCGRATRHISARARAGSSTCEMAKALIAASRAGVAGLDDPGKTYSPGRAGRPISVARRHVQASGGQKPGNMLDPPSPLTMLPIGSRIPKAL